MKDTVVFVANGFVRDNIRLQPWRYVYELAKHKTNSARVYVITEGASDLKQEDWDEGFTVVETNRLSIKKQTALGGFIQSLNPTELWWSTTPRSIAFYPLLSRITCLKVAFITCPLYRWMELVRASLSGVPYRQSKALWGQRLVPRFVFRWFLNSKLFDFITVQSKNNQAILESDGVRASKVSQLPVGIDDEDVKPVDQLVVDKISEQVAKKSDETVFLYLGALRPIRGFDSLLKAFPSVIERNSKARLVVLARGASEEKCNKLLADINVMGVRDSVTIIGGWLSREDVWAYLELSDIVVQPFVLVPSDIPIAVLESLARGKPVVVSPVDGLPELAMGRGVIVDPLNTRKFAEELYYLSEDKQRIEEYTQAAKQFIRNYPRWKDVGRLMDDIYNNRNQRMHE